MEINLNLSNDFEEETLFDFKDGRGLVPAHRHSKGGGWVEDTAHVDENCFIGSYAQVFGNARVIDKAIVNDYARVYGNAMIYGQAKVYGDSIVCENAQVYGNAKVSGFSKVYGNARISGNASLYELCEVYGDAIVRDNAQVLDHAKVYGKGDVYNSIKLYGNCVVTRKPICCIGFDYDTVVTDHHVIMGCVVIPPYYMKKLGRRIIEMVGYSSEMSVKWLTAIESIIDVYDCVDREEDLKSTNERKIFEELITGANARSNLEPQYRR